MIGEKPKYSQSEEDFREVVCNITSLKKDDPVFDMIPEKDKKVIKTAKRAIDMQKMMKDVSQK